MNYLYFDIECCDGNHMCSFGYVITNENFEILKKEDIVINPEKKFGLGRDRFNPRISLAYSEDVFKKSPNFKYYYQTIKDLLKSDNMVLLGHSISSDIKYLKIACERYGLEKIDLNVYDTQKFYYRYDNKYPSRGLENILLDLSIDTGSLSEHKSCDDAQMSMLVTKEICKRLNVTLQELLIMCEDAIENGQEKELTKKQYDLMKQAILESLQKKGITYEEYVKNLK